jgi:outer membrane protein TolC
MFSGGCHRHHYRSALIVDDTAYQQCADRVVSEIAGQAKDPDLTVPGADSPADTPEPRTILSDLPEEDDSKYWDLSLDKVVRFGLMNSRVLNDLGGTILRYPDAVPSNMMSAIVQSDPRFGIEGALSAFDARLNINSSLENNDRALNNLFLSGGNTGRTFVQTLDISRAELVKKTVTGGQLAVRSYTEYDRNTAPSNLFPSAWTVWYEAEARQSLLQGGGVQFNRIAGPYALPGYYNGVMIARVNADISQAEFEISLRDYLSNLENAYWDLHFAYRDLASKIDLRDMALEVYGLYEVIVEKQQKDEPYRLAQVREQYYRFQEDVQNSLTGRRIDGTRTNNGSIPGTFRGTTGVYLAERRLRLLMGVPTSDHRLIRPTDEATPVETVLDWELTKAEALTRRPELDRQRFRLKKAEMELVAAHNYLKPQLDLVGRYRFRGFGQNLVGYNNDPFSAVPAQRFQNAYADLMTGQFQESQVGVEFSMPIGFRQGYAAVAQAEFRLARERALLHEQERQIIHDVGDAVADVARAYAVAKTAWERRAAAFEYLDGLTNHIRLLDFGPAQLEQWLEAQRRFAEADTQYHLALIDHQIALKNVNYEKGSLLEYCSVATIDAFPAPPIQPVPALPGLHDIEPIDPLKPEGEPMDAEQPVQPVSYSEPRDDEEE